MVIPAIACLGMALLAGCASGPKSYAIRGDGDPVLNRDVNGQSLSVVVRVYQLKGAEEFSRLTFDPLADGRPESELLGQDLLGKVEAIVVPGGQYTNSEKLMEETRYVGVVAFFRRPDPQQWRFLVEADKVRGNGLAFRVQDCYVLPVDVKPVPIPGQPLNFRPDCGAATVANGRTGTPAANPQPATQKSAGPAPKQKRGWLPQNMPDVSVSSSNRYVPGTVQVGNGGNTAVTIGATPQPAAAPAYQPGYQPAYQPGYPPPSQPGYSPTITVGGH